MIKTDGIRLADAPGVGNGSARLAPAPYTAERSVHLGIEEKLK